MSAASRAREAAKQAEAALAKPLPTNEEDGPADSDDIAGQVQDWELDRLIIWFIQHHDKLCELHDAKSIVISEKYGLLVEKKPKPTVFGTFRHERR